METVSSTVTSDNIEELQYEIENLVTKKSELEKALLTIAGAMEQQKKVVAAATSQTPMNDKSYMERLFVAFLAGRKKQQKYQVHLLQAYKDHIEETSGST